jgi:hypothetical protein
MKTMIEELRDRSLNELKDGLEFYIHSALAYGSAIKEYQSKHKKSVKAPLTPIIPQLTDSIVSVTQFIKNLERHKEVTLHNLVFLQMVTVLETFFFDLLRLLFLDNPLRLPGDKQVKWQVVTQGADRESILNYLIDIQLNELKYKRPKEWFEYLGKLVKISGPSKEESEKFTEMKASRDVLIHNAGVVNEVYREKAATQARYSVGERVAIPHRYFLNSAKLVAKMIGDIADGLINKIGDKGSIHE